MQVAIVITDGKQTTDQGSFTELSVASRGLKDKNVKVFSLGIGRNIDRTQLNDIASSNNNVFTAASFAELAPVAETIVQNSCPGRFSLKMCKLQSMRAFYICINDVSLSAKKKSCQASNKYFPSKLVVKHETRQYMSSTNYKKAFVVREGIFKRLLLSLSLTTMGHFIRSSNWEEIPNIICLVESWPHCPGRASDLSVKYV